MRLVRFPWKLANRTNGGQIVPSLILPNSPALLTLLILTAQDSPYPKIFPLFTLTSRKNFGMSLGVLFTKKVCNIKNIQHYLSPLYNKQFSSSFIFCYIL